MSKFFKKISFIIALVGIVCPLQPAKVTVGEGLAIGAGSAALIGAIIQAGRAYTKYKKARAAYVNNRGLENEQALEQATQAYQSLRSEMWKALGVGAAGGLALALGARSAYKNNQTPATPPASATAVNVGGAVTSSAAAQQSSGVSSSSLVISSDLTASGSVQHISGGVSVPADEVNSGAAVVAITSLPDAEVGMSAGQGAPRLEPSDASAPRASDEQLQFLADAEDVAGEAEAAAWRPATGILISYSHLGDEAAKKKLARKVGDLALIARFRADEKAQAHFRAKRSEYKGRPEDFDFERLHHARRPFAGGQPVVARRFQSPAGDLALPEAQDATAWQDAHLKNMKEDQGFAAVNSLDFEQVKTVKGLMVAWGRNNEFLHGLRRYYFALDHGEPDDDVDMTGYISALGYEQLAAAAIASGGMVEQEVAEEFVNDVMQRDVLGKQSILKALIGQNAFREVASARLDSFINNLPLKDIFGVVVDAVARDGRFCSIGQFEHFLANPAVQEALHGVLITRSGSSSYTYGKRQSFGADANPQREVTHFKGAGYRGGYSGFLSILERCVSLFDRQASGRMPQPERSVAYAKAFLRSPAIREILPQLPDSTKHMLLDNYPESPLRILFSKNGDKDAVFERPAARPVASEFRAEYSSAADDRALEQAYFEQNPDFARAVRAVEESPTDETVWTLCDMALPPFVFDGESDNETTIVPVRSFVLEKILKHDDWIATLTQEHLQDLFGRVVGAADTDAALLGRLLNNTQVLGTLGTEFLHGELLAAIDRHNTEAIRAFFDTSGPARDIRREIISFDDEVATELMNTLVAVWQAGGDEPREEKFTSAVLDVMGTPEFGLAADKDLCLGWLRAAQDDRLKWAYLKALQKLWHNPEFVNRLDTAERAEFARGMKSINNALNPSNGEIPFTWRGGDVTRGQRADLEERYRQRAAMRWNKLDEIRRLRNERRERAAMGIEDRTSSAIVVPLQPEEAPQADSVQ